MNDLRGDGIQNLLHAREAFAKVQHDLEIAVLYRGAYCAGAGDITGFLNGLSEMKLMKAGLYTASLN